MYSVPARENKYAAHGLKPALAKDYTEQCPNGVRLHVSCKMSSAVQSIECFEYPISVEKKGCEATVKHSSPTLLTQVRELLR